MSPGGICYLDLVRSDVHGCFTLDEMAKDLWSIALLEASELLGEHAVKGVGDHSHNDVKVILDQNAEDSASRLKNLTASAMAFSMCNLRA